MTAADLALFGKPLVAALLTLAVSWCLGRTLFRFLPDARTGLRPLELGLFSLGLGFALLSQIVFLLGICGLYHDAAFILVAVAAVAAWALLGRSVVAGESQPADAGERRWRWLVLALSIPFLPYWLTNALSPEIGPDALGYHLGLVARYYREHALIAATNSVYSFLSQGAEMVYLFAYAFGREDAPKIVHFALFLATLASLVAFSRRYSSGAAGWIACGLYAFASIVPKDATMAYNDCALAFFALLTLYALLLWAERRDTHTLCVTAILAGFCFSLKYTAAPLVAVAGLAVLIRAWRSRQGLGSGLKPVAAFCGVAFLFVAPWVGRNLVIAHSPLAPFFNKQFPNPYVTLDWERRYRDFLTDYRNPDERQGWRDKIAKVFDVTLDGRRTGGIVGPVFLIAPFLLLLAWGTPRAGPLAVAAAVTTLPWLSNAGTRFLIPGLVFVALLMAQAILRLGRAAWPVGVALLAVHAAVNWTPLIPLWRGSPVTFLRLDEVPWRAALRIVSEREYRNRRVDRFVLAEALKKSAPPGSRALFLGADFPEAIFPGVIYFSEIGALGEDLGRDLLMAIDQDFRPEKLIRVGWREKRTIDGFRIRQTQSADQSWWELAEIQPVSDGEAFEWPSDWSIDTSQRPYRNSRLIDGDPASMWRSWQPLRPGLIELTGPDSVKADGVEVLSGWGQHWSEYEFEIRSAGGAWERIEPALGYEKRELSPDALAAYLRRAFAEAGITYVAADLGRGADRFLAQRIDEDPAAFSLETMWSHGDDRVWRVVQ